MSAKPIQDQSIYDLIGGPERRLIISSLQSLHRERLAAWKTANRLALDTGRAAPAREDFALNEPEQALKRLGADTSVD